MIRTADRADAEAVVALMGELGYPDTPVAIERRVLHSTMSEQDVVLVAEVDGRVVAVASVHLIPLFHRDGSLARITSFVVATAARRRGTGTTLLEACEAWARERRAERVEITSGDEREDAHAFYRRSGYAREGERFSRSLER